MPEIPGVSEPGYTPERLPPQAQLPNRLRKLISGHSYLNCYSKYLACLVSQTDKFLISDSISFIPNAVSF